MAFSIFGKKDEPDKKNEPAAKKEPVAGKPAGPSTISPALAKTQPAKPMVTPSKPPAAPAKTPVAKESVPVEEDDLDFTSLLSSPPAPASPPEPAAAAPKVAPPAPPPPAARAPAPQPPKAPAAAPPAAKAAPAPASAPAPSPQAKAAPAAVADMGAIDAGTLGTGAKSGPATFEKTWMPEGRALAPEKQAPAKPAAPPPAAPSRPRGTASAGPAAPPPIANAPKPAAAPAPAAPPPVAVPAAKAAEAPAKPAAPAVTAATAQPAEAPPAKASAPEKVLPPAIEKAAVLFANGQAEGAVAALKAAIAKGDLGDAAVQAWLMLFDLYQLQGRKDEHEALALEFVVKFERSAPAWRDEPKTVKDPALQTGAGSYFALTRELTADSAPEIAQLLKLAEKNPMLRIEFGKLQGVDAAGAQLLLDALKGFGKTNRELILSNHTTLVDLLGPKAEVGKKDEPQVYWMLLLELFQVLGLQTQFDDAALNFAITYELSPPSFEERAKPAKAETPSATTDTGEDGFVMTGEICSTDEAVIAALAKYAANRDDVVIDMSRAKRVDSVAAGAMLKLVTALAGSGKSVQIRSANELIGALFQVVGIARLAQLVKRR